MRLGFVPFAVACGKLPEYLPDPNIEIDGVIAGDEAPAAGVVIAVWDGAGLESGVFWKWGEGASSGRTWSIRLEGPPPRETRLDPDLDASVGWLVLLPEGTVVADGEWWLAEDGISGATRRGWVVWKKQEADVTGDWYEPLPFGWSCLECEDAAGGGKDPVDAVDCDDLVIYLRGDPDAPDWCDSF